MKLKPLFIFLLAINHNSILAQHTYRQEVNHLVSIDFPDTIKTGITNGLQSYKATKKSNIFLCFSYDVSDSATMIRTQEDLDDFYVGVINGTSTSSKTIKIKYHKSILIDSLEGLDFEYVNSFDPKKPIFVFERAVYFNKNAFVCMFMTHNESQVNNQIERDKFFNSFKIIIPKKDIEQFPVPSSMPYSIGYVIGKTVGKILIIGFFALIIIFIVKIFSRKKVKENE